MINNLSISTTFISDGTMLYKALKLCKDIEIDFIEIGSNHCYEENYDYLSKFSFKYLVHNYFPIPKKSFVLNISSLDNNIRERSIKHVKYAIDFCYKHNCHLYTFHPGFLSDPMGSNYSKDNYDFIWEEEPANAFNYNKSKDLMYKALDEILLYANLKNIKIAIETEGSLTKKNYLLIQQPNEYIEFISKYSPSDIGINLNIGHMNLASRAFHFEKLEFVDLIANYVVAMELSHNNGLEDQHLPLEVDGWYWDLINDNRFKEVFKILEYRNTEISVIKKNIQMIKEKTNANPIFE